MQRNDPSSSPLVSFPLLVVVVAVIVVLSALLGGDCCFNCSVAAFEMVVVVVDFCADELGQALICGLFELTLALDDTTLLLGLVSGW